MSLRNKISDDLKLAFKEGRGLEVQVLRMVSAALQNKEIEKKGGGGEKELSDEEVLEILRRELKKRQEAAGLYRQGNRLELAEAEEKEAEVIIKYLPKQMSDEDVEKKVDEILSGLEEKNFGDVMKAVMAELKGKVDGKKLAEIIKAKL